MSSGEKDLAVNDIVLTREGNLRIVQFNVYVNGTLLNTYQADGVIICTPTGSTGYNLSRRWAGGRANSKSDRYHSNLFPCT